MRRLLTIGAMALALVVTSPPPAQAHRGTVSATRAHIIDSHMKGHCGNGFFSQCLDQWMTTWFSGIADAHSYRFGGGWRETRLGIPKRVYACYANFVSGPHGVGIWGEVCYRV